MVSGYKKAVILGCGYLGGFLARELLARGWEVHAVRRDWGQAGGVSKDQIHHHSLDIHSDDWFRDLPRDPAVVFNFLSAGGQGLEGYRKNYLEAQYRVRDWFSTLSRPPGDYFFTSSSRVYPQDGDVWVTEAEAPECLPDDPSGDLLRQAEKAISSWEESLVCRRTILRVAGIYGPGRNFLLRQVRSGAGFVQAHCQHFLNLIRVEDICGAIFALLHTPTAGEGTAIYNLSDGNPSRKADIVAWLAEQCGRETDLWCEDNSPQLPTRGRGGKRSSRRIGMAKIVEATGWKPAYPSFREGYGNLLAKD